MIPVCPKCEQRMVEFYLAALTNEVDDIVLRVTNAGVVLRTSAGKKFTHDDLDSQALGRCTSCRHEDQGFRFTMDPPERRRFRKDNGFDETAAREVISARRKGGLGWQRGLKGFAGGRPAKGRK